MGALGCRWKGDGGQLVLLNLADVQQAMRDKWPACQSTFEPACQSGRGSMHDLSHICTLLTFLLYVGTV